MKSQKFLVAFATLALASPILAATSDPDEMYLQAFTLIQKADTSAEGNSVSDAIKTYESAGAILTHLRTLYPAYNTKLVEYRESGVAAAADNLKLPSAQRAKFKPVASKQVSKD